MRKLISVCILIAIVVGGCGKKAEDAIVQVPVNVETAAPATTAKPKATATPKPTEDLTGKAINPLTGKYIDEEAASRRPVAVVINNMRKALPQSGIGQADILYEVLAEGDITRIVAFFQEFNSEKIGPVRSTRHYFLDFALGHDAIFVHHGGSPQGYNDLRSLAINNIDAMTDGNSTFWRDQQRVNQAGMYEHSSYTKADNILATAEKRGIREERKEDFGAGFGFYPIAAVPAKGKPCQKLTVAFSPAYTSVFEYDPSSKLYKKLQGDASHIDEETGQQISVSNVLVQVTSMYVISGDDAGRREVKTVGSGDGYLITNGEYAPVKWSRASRQSSTLWTDMEGNELKLNKGKTWICVFDRAPQFE